MALFDVPVEKYCPENFQDIKVLVLAKHVWFCLPVYADFTSS